MAANNIRNNESLVGAVDQALASTPRYDNPDFPRLAALWSSRPELTALYDQLRTVDSLACFENGLEIFGDPQQEFGREDLAHWILKRADEVGARQALENVDRYLEQPDFLVYDVMFLHGIRPEMSNTRTAFDGDIYLIHPFEAPTKSLRDLLPSVPTGKSGSLMGDVQALLVRPYREKKKYRPKEVKKSGVKTHAAAATVPDLTELDDIRLCLALPFEEGLSVQAISTTTVAADEVPTGVSIRFGSRSYRGNAGYSTILQGGEEKKAHSLYKKFRALNGADRNHLRVPMQRYCDYEASVAGDRIQSAIDLRVVLDSLFLNDQYQGELGYRLALRAALFVGGNLAEKKKLRKDVTDVYGFGSKAVHNGRLKLKPEQKQQMSRVRKMIRTVLCQMILANKANPDWAELELGAAGGCRIRLVDEIKGALRGH